MDLFDIVAQGKLGALEASLARDPALAAQRNAAGASLLAWTGYVRNRDATALVRAALPAVTPHEAIIIGENDALRQHLAEGWDASTLSPDGFTPLALAAFFANAPAFDLLLPLTADIDARAKNPQQVAAIHAAIAARQPRMVELLLRAGASPDLAQADGFTALHAAAQHGDSAQVGMLLLFGANPFLRNLQGKHAADHARAGGHAWLADRLEALKPEQAR